MKMPIAWHKDCLANQRRHYASLKVQIERLENEYAMGQKNINAYDAQIIEAELRGVDEFDRKKFGFKRKPSSAAPQGSAKENK